MADRTKIQWCHSTVNPIMGCGGCELFPAPGEILKSVDEAIGTAADWPPGKSRALMRELVDESFSKIKTHFEGHAAALSTTNIWHHRDAFLKKVSVLAGRVARKAAEGVIASSITCYAAKLHLNKARSIVSPSRGFNVGYAPAFEKVTQFEGRVWKMAKKKDLLHARDPKKPWLDGLPRLIFVSDMGDAFSRNSDFSFLEAEVIEPIRSPLGRRHMWLWLTKRPDRMARFGERIGGFPDNVCAMTTVTSPDMLFRVDQLRDVPAAVRGLSLEPLRERIPPKDLKLKGISWVIVGGESGRRAFVPPFDLFWARETRNLCRQRKVAFFLKQLGRRPVSEGEELKLRDSHGGDWSEWPKDLRVREMPAEFKTIRG
ncbi:MAG: DUF5131 family protein [Verrucomicrobiota bacterium]